MIAISLWQPWATAIAIGLKTYETRAWAAECIGTRISIHAAKTQVHPKTRERLQDWWMAKIKRSPDPKWIAARDTFAAHGFHDWCDLPFGAIVCEADLIAVETTEKLVESGRVTEDSGEFRWGNFAPIDDENHKPRYGWQLANVVRLPTPAPCKGWQNFFKWNPATNETVGLAPAWKGRAA